MKGTVRSWLVVIALLVGAGGVTFPARSVVAGGAARGGHTHVTKARSWKVQRRLTVRNADILCAAHPRAHFLVVVRAFYVHYRTFGPAGAQVGGDGEIFDTARPPLLPIESYAFTFWGKRGGMHVLELAATVRRYGGIPLDAWATIAGELVCYVPFPTIFVDSWMS